MQLNAAGLSSSSLRLVVPNIAVTSWATHFDCNHRIYDIIDAFCWIPNNHNRMFTEVRNIHEAETLPES